MKIYVKSAAFDMFADVYKKRVAEVEQAAKRIAKKYGLQVKIKSNNTPIADIMNEIYIDVYDGTEYLTSIIVNAYKKGWAIQSPNSGKTKLASHTDVIDMMERLFWSFSN